MGVSVTRQHGQSRFSFSQEVQFRMSFDKPEKELDLPDSKAVGGRARHRRFNCRCSHRARAGQEF